MNQSPAKYAGGVNKSLREEGQRQALAAVLRLYGHDVAEEVRKELERSEPAKRLPIAIANTLAGC